MNLGKLCSEVIQKDKQYDGITYICNLKNNIPNESIYKEINTLIGKRKQAYSYQRRKIRNMELTNTNTIHKK